MLEEADFRHVYDAHIRQIYAYCLRRVAEADAQDVAAEVFLVLWRRWDDRPEGDELTPWMYGIARNVLANSKRSLLRSQRLSAKLARLRSVDGPGPEAVTLAHENHREVLEALAELPDAHQETLRLVEWEGLSREQVADLDGVSRAAIDQRISRAYRRLAEILNSSARPAGPRADRIEPRTELQ